MSVAATLVIGGGAPAAAQRTLDSAQLQYQFTLRAAPVETYAHFFRELVQGVAFSRVQLTQRRGEVGGIARAVAAAVWPITDEEPCLLGCEPPCPESTVVNPTVARTSAPLECNERVPGFAASGLPPQVADALSSGIAPEVAASTPNDATATGSSRIGDFDFGDNRFAGAGSVSTARINTTTGRLRASARSFVTRLQLPDGGVASIASTLAISALSDERPTVDYQLSFASAGSGKTRSGLDQTNFTISGTKIPITDLVTTFNDSLTAIGSQLRILAALGIRVLAPTTDFTAVGTRYRVSAPVLMVGVEPGVALPTPTRDGGVRIGAATFEGNYGRPDAPLR